MDFFKPTPLPHPSIPLEIPIKLHDTFLEMFWSLKPPLLPQVI